MQQKVCSHIGRYHYCWLWSFLGHFLLDFLSSFFCGFYVLHFCLNSQVHFRDSWQHLTWQHLFWLHDFGFDINMLGNFIKHVLFGFGPGTRDCIAVEWLSYILSMVSKFKLPCGPTATLYCMKSCTPNHTHTHTHYKMLLFYLFYDTLHTYIAILVSHFCYYQTLVS